MALRGSAVRVRLAPLLASRAFQENVKNSQVIWDDENPHSAPQLSLSPSPLAEMRRVAPVPFISHI